MSEELEKYDDFELTDPDEIEEPDEIITPEESESLVATDDKKKYMVKKPETQEKLVLRKDFKFARRNIRNAIDTATNVIENLGRLAQDTESPRIYECLISLLQIQTLNNKLLIDLDKDYDEAINGKSVKVSEEVTQNNTLIVTTQTTTDIQKMIEEKLRNKI